MKLVVVQIRGTIGATQKAVDTLKMLNLTNANSVTIVEDAPHIQGMLRLVRHLVTWGPADENTVKAITKKKGKKISLNPPKKGYGRKGIKTPFAKGGAFGSRGEKINDLVARMM